MRWMASLAVSSSELWADQSGAATLEPNTFLNLDSGAASSAGADILWDGAAPGGLSCALPVLNRGEKQKNFLR